MGTQVSSLTFPGQVDVYSAPRYFITPAITDGFLLCAGSSIAACFKDSNATNGGNLPHIFHLQSSPSFFIRPECQTRITMMKKIDKEG